MQMKFWGMALAAMAVLVAAVTPAEAGIQWVGGNDGTQHWGVPGNWHKSRLPEATDEVNIGSTLNLGDAWVLFDASDGTGLTNNCYLGRDYDGRLDQSGGTIDVNLYLAISGNPSTYGTYNLSGGTLDINNQEGGDLELWNELCIGSADPHQGNGGPGEMNHTAGQINTLYMGVGENYAGKYAVAPAADLNVSEDLILGDSGTLDLLLDSQTNLDINVGGAVTLGGYLWVTGALTPGDLTTGVKIMTAASFSGSFHIIEPGFGVELRNSDTELWLVANQNQPPQIDQHPEPVEVCPTLTATFSTLAYGEGTLTYKWQKKVGENWEDMADDERITGTDTTTLEITLVQSGDAGEYRCKVSNEYGTVYTNAATLTVLDCGQHPYDPQTGGIGTAWNILYQLEAEDYDLGGELISYHDTSPANLGGHYRALEGVDIWRCFDCEGHHEGHGGGHCYNVGEIRDTEWLEFTVNVATAGTYAVQARVACGDSDPGDPHYGGEFHLEMDGTPVGDPIAFGPTVGMKNGVEVVGLFLTVPGPEDPEAIVTLSQGEQVLRLAMDRNTWDLNWIRFLATAGPPTVTQHPRTQTICAGDTVRLKVAGVAYIGTGELTYQWQKNGGNLTDGGTISGALTDTLQITNTQAADAGTYRCVVSNDNGGTTSKEAELTVLTDCGAQNPYDPENPGSPGTPWALPGLIEAEYYDLGGQYVAYYDTDTYNDGHLLRDDEAVDIYGDEEEGYAVGRTRPGEFLEYTVNVAAADIYDVWIRLSNGGDYCGADFHIEMDGVDVTGPVHFPTTHGYENYMTRIIEDVPLPGGEQILRLVVDQPGWNVDRILVPGIFCYNPFADADGDGDVDQTDFANFQRCYTGLGPGSEIPEDDPYCACFDTNFDQKISETDYLEFERYATGPGVRAY